MSGDVQLELWLHEYEMAALSAVLEEQGTTVENRMQEMLVNLYADLVPHEVQQEIRTRMDAERAAWEAEQEAARKYTAFRVRENGVDSFFQLDSQEDILEVAKFLRRYLRGEQGQAVAALQTSAFAGMKPVTAEQYDQLAALRMENPNRITGVFDLDFDKQEVSTADAVDGWKTWSMRDVSAAVYHAYRKSSLRPEQYMTRFLDKLEVDLHWADGREEAVTYRLNAVEKATLLRNMDEYCQQQIGQTLAEYSAQRMAEDMTAPSGPMM